MIKRLLALASSIALAVSLWAIPARRMTQIVKQPDGTSISITLQGDEHFHYLSTTDGLPLFRTATGSYCYATISGNTLKPSSVVAHEASLRTEDELHFLSQSVPTTAALGTLRQKRLQTDTRSCARRQPMMRSTVADAVNKTSQTIANILGQHKGLVLLVNFKDEKMQSQHTLQAFDDQFNLEGYNVNGNSGSVHDYFKEQSYGQFDLTFDVVGPVTVSKNMAAYGANDSNGNDKNPAGMVYEAVKLAKKQNPNLNFKDYDWNNDGYVDQVYVIYAGYGEASDVDGTLTNTIWPHEWELQAGGYFLEIDGVKVNTYGCSSELMGNTYYPVMMDGIGSACHEFSHCLGLPDIYDTSGNNTAAFGMDFWSLMDYGCYGGDGYAPVAYTSYERWMSGWLTPKELTQPTSIANMKALSEAPDAYIIYNDAYPDEYYMLENRQQTGTDAEAPGHGLLVLHIDYEASAWKNNEVNNVKSHQRCSIIPADNKLTSGTLAGDPFPGTSHKTQLTDNSTPIAKLFHANTSDKKLMSKPITDISESATGLITFNFMGGSSTTGITHTSLSNNAANTSPVYDAAGRYIGIMNNSTFDKARQNSGSWLIKRR